MLNTLVILPNWFGEVLFAEPFLRTLYQDGKHEVTVLGWPQAEIVLKNHPAVKAFIPFDEKGRDRSLFKKWQLSKTLKSHHFDVAFILRPSLSRTFLLKLAGIPKRVGFAHNKSQKLLTDFFEPADSQRHKAEGYLKLLNAIGLSATPSDYRYFVSDAERQAVEAFALPEKFIVLHAGANWDHKRWPIQRFIQLAEYLQKEFEYEIVFTGAEADRAEIEVAVAGMAKQPRVLAGKTNIRELGACIEGCQLFVSNDTGITHIAAALDKPVVALFGPTSPAFTGPMGDGERVTVLHKPDACPEIPCFDPQGDHPGMKSLSVDEVLAACLKTIAKDK